MQGLPVQTSGRVVMRVKVMAPHTKYTTVRHIYSPAMLQSGLPMFAGRWNDYLTRHYTYDVEPGPGGGVRSKVARHAIEEEVANLQRTRLWVWHHKIAAPTLLFRAPDGLVRSDDCLMTQEEAKAMAHAIPNCRLVVVPHTNHYTVLLGENPVVTRELRAFLAG